MKRNTINYSSGDMTKRAEEPQRLGFAVGFFSWRFFLSFFVLCRCIFTDADREGGTSTTPTTPTAPSLSIHLPPLVPHSGQFFIST
jgi:hypothetical protein